MQVKDPRWKPVKYLLLREITRGACYTTIAPIHNHGCNKWLHSELSFDCGHAVSLLCHVVLFDSNSSFELHGSCDTERWETPSCCKSITAVSLCSVFKGVCPSLWHPSHTSSLPASCGTSPDVMWQEVVGEPMSLAGPLPESSVWEFLRSSSVCCFSLPPSSWNVCHLIELQSHDT